MKLPNKAASFFCILEERGDQLSQLGGQVCVTLFGQMHIVHGVELRAQFLGIGKVAADQSALFLIIMCQFPGLFL